MKILKILGVTLLGIIVLAGGFAGYIYFTQPASVYAIKEFESEGEPVLDCQLSKEEVKEDIESIIKIMESCHPIFLEKVPEAYYTSKEELLSVSNTAMTVGELQNEISKYLSSVQDGHTTLWWEEDNVLDVDWKYQDEKLILLDKEKKLSHKVVKQIGNVDIGKIIKSIKETFPAENYIAEARNIESHAKGRILLENAGVETNQGVNLILESNGQEESLQAAFIPNANNGNEDDSIYSKKIDESTAYIRLATCEVNKSLQGVIENIKEYRNEGMKNFIIDVTDNPGGDSTACQMLLEALDMKLGGYGCVIRFSPLAQEQRGYLRKHGSITYHGNNEAVKNEDINLYVLTNERTFSSAQMLCVSVADGGLGTLVGRPSSNRPSCYGDVLYYQLENSKLAGQISHKKWTRPDITKDKEQTLEPDIYVEYGDDILESALKAIK